MTVKEIQQHDYLAGTPKSGDGRTDSQKLKK